MSFYSEFAEYYEEIFPFREEVYSFLKGFMPRGSLRVLDLGCGTGHYCGRLAADGLRALGIDLDVEMIAFARSRYPQAAFRCRNMLGVARLKPAFDATFCIGNVAAHLNPGQFSTLVKSVRELLREGGVWIFQVVNWDFILAQGSYSFPVKYVGNGEISFVREYLELSEQRLRFRTQLVSAGKKIFEGSVWLYPMRAEEYFRVHKQLGYELVGHFSDYRRSKFDPGSDSASIFVFKV